MKRPFIGCRFLELTDAQLQEPITETLLAQLIAHPKGLFKESQGKRILCLNQTHTRREFVQAMNVCLQLPKSCFEKIRQDYCLQYGIRERTYFMGEISQNIPKN